VEREQEEKVTFPIREMPLSQPGNSQEWLWSGFLLMFSILKIFT